LYNYIVNKFDFIMYPSYIGFGLGGLLLGIVIIILICALCTSQKMDSNKYSMLTVLLLLSIAFGIHGLGHAYAEVNYGFNPLEGKWNYQLQQ